MTDSTSNIEAVARDICLKQLSRFGGAELDADVDRYWHCVAAELELGQIDETGNRGPVHSTYHMRSAIVGRRCGR